MPELTGTIRIVRSGGFAGLKASASVELASLDPAQRSALGRLFADDTPRGDDRRRDGFTYQLTGTLGGAERSITVTEQQLPPGIAALVKDTLPPR